MGGDVIVGDGAAVWSGAALDSRRVEGGELFFALAGERTDGHRFVGDALARGAAGAVVEREVEGLPTTAQGLVRVADTYEGLHALVRALRRELPEVLVGITGSVGKTTTKEATAAVLAGRFRTARNPGNLNNLYGFPLAFLGIPDDTEVMVAELGMSVPGELGRVSALARPDGVVLTNVRPAHLASFPDVSAIAEAKAEIFEGLPSGAEAFVVANRDDPEVVRVTERWAASRGPRGGRVIWFGLAPADGRAAGAARVQVRGRSIRPAPLADGRTGIAFTLEIAGNGSVGTMAVELPLHGRYNVYNALAAAGVGHALGLGIEEIAQGLAHVRPAAHRGAVHRLAGPGGSGGTPITLVDDSYNSNPDALARALESAAELAGREARGAGGRLVAILGDMLELGPEAPRFHRQAGHRAAELGFAPVVGVGPLAEELVAGAREAGATAVHLADAATAADWAEESLRPGDLVLVKGSRGVALDAVVERLLAPRVEESFVEGAGEGEA